MRKVISYVVYSLDGVAQNPQDFVFDRFDSEMMGHLQALIDRQDAVLLGRVTYEEWSRYWPTSNHEPFASFINNTPKYVASSTLTEATWKHSALTRDIAATIATLKESAGRDIGVHGSIELVRSLLRANLLDELKLAMFPAIAGKGKRLFEGFDEARPLRLAGVERTAKGVLMLTYQRHDS